MLYSFQYIRNNVRFRQPIKMGHYKDPKHFTIGYACKYLSGINDEYPDLEFFSDIRFEQLYMGSLCRIPRRPASKRLNYFRVKPLYGIVLKSYRKEDQINTRILSKNNLYQRGRKLNNV